MKKITHMGEFCDIFYEFKPFLDVFRAIYALDFDLGVILVMQNGCRLFKKLMQQRSPLLVLL